LLLEEHGINLLLQSCNHGEELLLSGLGGGRWMPRGIPPVAVVVGEILAVAMAMVTIPHRRISSLLHLYL